MTTQAERQLSAQKKAKHKTKTTFTEKSRMGGEEEEKQKRVVKTRRGGGDMRTMQNSNRCIYI